MSDIFDIVTSATLYAAAIRLALPIFLAALGETYAERAGLVNVGLEGMMLMGAFGAVLGSDLTGSPVAGALIGIFFALLIAAIQGLVAINLGADQIVCGIALNIAALGLTAFLARTIWEGGNAPQVDGFSPFSFPLLSEAPFLGTAVFKQSAFVYLALVLALISWWALTKTGWGLKLRGCGEDPRACDSFGIPVLGMRWQAMMVCGACAGLGGVFLALGQLLTFSDGMSGGRGFIALAVVIIARWSPVLAIPAALLFGGLEAFALRVQSVQIDVPAELMLALPYVMTIVVYAIVVGRSNPPAALGRSYVRQ
jgi:simple sugar transport system permease protein